MEIKTFFDQDTFTLTYIVWDESTKDSILIDPVLNYDPASGKANLHSIHLASDFIKSEKLKLHYILETHAHADHITGSQELKTIFPNAKIGIGKEIQKVQETFKEFFNIKNLKTDGSQFDELFSDNQTFNAGSLEVKVLHTPGHTPACVSYVIDDAVFTGDALFMHDYGTGRCDFPKGSATDLYNSVKSKIYALPDTTRVFVGHDYQPNGRDLKFESSIALEKKHNPHIKDNTSEEEFVNFRQKRDATLKAPRLLLPSIQVNIRAGHLPEPEENGTTYLKLPIAIEK